MDNLARLRSEVQAQAHPQKGAFLQRFFKTGEGEYGHGDVFLGLTVPQSRKIAIRYKDLPFEDIKILLQSKYHEERLIALLLLVHNFTRNPSSMQKIIYDFYLTQIKNINNWDLVDLSADKIVGGYLLGKRDKMILKSLAKSDNLWERRIAIVSTFQFIKHGIYTDTFAIADILLHDKEDLIQKAVGWMLREVGKRCSREVEEEFLRSRYKEMPRTMLRYAIERMPEERRRAYIEGKI